MANFMKSQHLGPDEEQISLDVESLFTSIPTEVAVTAAQARLVNDTTLSTRTQLAPGDICILLRFCLGSTEFAFRNKFFRQIHGTAMGSPVSVVVANLTMEVVEERALTTFLFGAPRIYRRFVDDTYIVMMKDTIQQFFQHMNSINEHIKFTIEYPTDGHLAFLDLDLSIDRNRKFQVDIYRKACHTDQYLNFRSHHPGGQRRGTAMSLMYRAATLPSTPELQSAERERVRAALHKNGYPPRVLTEASRTVRQNLRRHPNDDQDTTSAPAAGFVCLPYVAGVTERLARILRSQNIRVTEKPLQKIRNHLVHPKNAVDPLDRRGAVYKVKCVDCGAKYVGETKRTTRTRIEEHKRALRLDQPEKSAMAEHALTTGHDVDWAGVEVVDREDHWLKRRWKEAIAIKTHGASLNRDQGLILPPQYSGII